MDASLADMAEALRLGEEHAFQEAITQATKTRAGLPRLSGRILRHPALRRMFHEGAKFGRGARRAPMSQEPGDD
ncbi:hypothetical protein LCGC14_1448040 [marine sediment metagenome]|uniref:Uncharacterized protein n=1 Tax=marine sediment metagenome TaxID=412755 RepID=A0A0F9JJD7_9ZZZZ